MNEDFSLKKLQDTFNYMDETPVQETTNKDIQLTVMDNKGNKYWIDYNEWLFTTAWRKWKSGFELTEEEKKILNLKNE